MAPRILYVLSVCLVFLGGVQVFTVGLSLSRIAITQPIAAGILILSLVAALFYGRLWPCTARDDSLSVPEGCRHKAAVAFIVLAGLLFYGFLWVLAARKIDYSFDGNMYHIPVIHFWARQGYVHWIHAAAVPKWCRLLEGALNGFPSGGELLSYILVKASNADAILNTTNLAFLPLGILGIVYMSRLLGATPIVAWCAGFLYMFVPVNIGQSPTTYVDSAFGSCMLALMACLCAAHVRLKDGHIPWELVLPLGSAMGWVMSIKSTGLLFVGFAFAWLGVASAIGFFAMRGRKRFAQVMDVTSLLFVLAVCAVLIGGHWTLRNYSIGGSPIYPVQVKVAGRVLFPGDPIETLFDGNRQTPGEMRPMSGPKKVLYTWTQGGSKQYWLECLGQPDSRRGGLGFFWILGCVPAILIILGGLALSRICLFRTTPEHQRASTKNVFLFLFLFALGAFWATPYNWWARYTVWICGVGFPAFAVLLQCSWRRGLRYWPLRCWTTGCVVILLFEGFYSLGRVCEHPPPSWLPYEGTPYWKPAQTSLYCKALADKDAAIALYQISARGQSLLGTFCQPIGRRGVFFLDEETANNEEKLKQYFKEKQVRYLFCGRGPRLPSGLDRLALHREEYRGWNLLVFSLPATGTS